MSPPKYAHVEFVNSNQVLQPNELRVGNFVAKRIFTVGMPDYYIIDPVDAEYIFKVSIGKSECNGVVLTPGILEKAGFEYEGITTLTKENFPVYFKVWSDGKLPAFAFYLMSQVEVPCKYLHQLQNLYHSLTGTELEIEL